MDFRALVGLAPDDAGSLIERVIARVVLDAAVRQHNEDAAAA